MGLISPESGKPPSEWKREFQPVIRYREFERSPVMIAKQTYTLLELFHQGAIHKPELAKDYFHDYTFAYLDQAKNGADTLYDTKGAVYEDLDLETREVAHHAFIVFTNLPDNMTSYFLPMGFSRRGMLKAPTTKEGFLSKIKELKIGIWQTISGEIQPRTTLEAYPRLLRTYGFFKVGSELPIKMSESEERKEKTEKEKFNELLKDVSF